MKLFTILVLSAAFLAAQGPPPQPTHAEQDHVLKLFKKMAASEKAVNDALNSLRGKYSVPPACQLAWATRADPETFHWQCPVAAPPPPAAPTPPPPAPPQPKP